MSSSNQTRIRGLLLFFLIISTGYTLYSLSNYSPIRDKQVVRVRTSFTGLDRQTSEFLVETLFQENGMLLKISISNSPDGYSHSVSFQNRTIDLDIFASSSFDVFYEKIDYFSESFKFEISLGSESATKSVWITRFSSLKYMVPHIAVIAIIVGLYMLVGKMNDSEV